MYLSMFSQLATLGTRSSQEAGVCNVVDA